MAAHRVLLRMEHACERSHAGQTDVGMSRYQTGYPRKVSEGPFGGCILCYEILTDFSGDHTRNCFVRDRGVGSFNGVVVC